MQGVRGAFSCRSFLNYHSCPPLSPSLCCASTHLWSHSLNQVGLIQLENRLSIRMHGVISQPDQSHSPALDAAMPEACNGCKWPANLDSRTLPPACTTVNCVLHYITAEESQPQKICLNEPQSKDGMLWRERFSRSKALFKVMASGLAGEERKT